MSTPRTRKELSKIGKTLPRRVLAQSFVDLLHDLPEGFTWMYDRVEGDNCGCALSVAHHVGLIDGWTTEELSQVLGLSKRKVYGICYNLNATRCVKLVDVTSDMVADAFQSLIGPRPID